MEQKIYSKIIEAMGKITSISKDRKNTQGNGFMYRGVDDVMNELHGIFSQVGIFIVPEVLKEERTQTTSQKGNVLYFTRLLTKFTFFADDGSSVSATVMGEAMDSGDKASNKALSVGFKYACLQVFCIPTEEEKDPDSQTHTLAPPKQEQPKINEALDAKIKELESYYSIISPEAKVQCEKAVTQRNEIFIDKFLEQAKNKRAELDAPQEQPPDEYELEIEQLIESTISGKPMFTDDEKKKIYARLESEWSKKVLEDVKVVVGNRAEGKGDQLDIF